MNDIEQIREYYRKKSISGAERERKEREFMFDAVYNNLPEDIQQKTKPLHQENIRTYVFPNGSEYTIVNPVLLYVRESGNHVIIDLEGYSHYVEKQWLTIRWKSDNYIDF